MKRISAAPEEVDIIDLSHEAHGVARLDGKAVFVADALPGERVVLRRVRRHRNFDEAVLESVITASPDRVAPPCPHYGTCGGCALQHLSPAAQLAFKQAQLIENLARLGSVEPGRVLEPLTPGQAPLRYALPRFDVSLEFEPTDFIQVNGPLNESMVSRAVELLDPQAEERVLDLFCGLGNFSLPLARRAGEVLGVEGDAGLVSRAERNAVRLGIGNVAYLTADLAAPTLDAAWATRRYHRVLLDPPRAGAREVLPVVGACRAERVVYISCHPGSLARDAGILVRDHGFRLVAAGVMDMFPHTTHVEAMAVFER